MCLQIFYHEIVHKTLFACCTEIVIFACQPGNPRFPWVLDCFELDAFYFYKIIELVVSTIRERLSRDVIKHLSTVSICIYATNFAIFSTLSNSELDRGKYSRFSILEIRESAVG